jgi:hypothetical protein
MVRSQREQGSALSSEFILLNLECHMERLLTSNTGLLGGGALGPRLSASWLHVIVGHVVSKGGFYRTPELSLFNYREGEWLCLFIELNSVLRLHGLSPCILFAQIAVCKPLAFHSSRGKNSFEVPLRRVQSLQTIPSIFAADSAYFLLVFLSKLLDLLLLSWLTKHTYPLC